MKSEPVSAADWSIIIPTLDEADEIGATLDNVLAFQPGEVIVVDGGSRDATVACAARPGVRIEASAAGRAMQQNHGARLARGDVLMFLHADGRFSANPLPYMQTALARPGVVGGGFSAAYPERGLFYWWLRKSGDLRFRLDRTLFGDQACFVRRSAFEGIGGFDESSDVEDADFSWRLSRLGELRLLPPILTISSRRYRQHGKADTVWSNQTRYWRWRLTRRGSQTPTPVHPKP